MSTRRPIPARRAVTTACLAALAGPAAAIDYCMLIDPNSCNATTEVVTERVVVDNGSYELSHGLYRASDLIVGSKGNGVVVQTGGVSTVTQRLVLGAGWDSTASYLLANGVLNANTEIVGEWGPSTFVQLGGLHTVNGELLVDWQGSFLMGGGVLQAGSLYLYDRFQQNAGTTVIGGDIGMAFADIVVNGGSLSVMGVTHINGGSLVHNGGEIRLSQPMQLGNDRYGDWGNYFANGGTLVGDIAIVASGRLYGGGGTVTGRVHLTRMGDIVANIGTTRLGSLLAEGYGQIQVSTALEVAQDVSIGSFNTLSMRGGTLTSAGELLNEGLITGQGTLGGTGRMRGSGKLVVDGGTLTLARGGGVELDGDVDVGAAGNTLLLQTKMAARGQVQLSGGTVGGGGTLALEGPGRLVGWGRVDGPITNNGRIEAQGGTLTLGMPLRNTGTLVVQPGAVLAGAAVDNRSALVVGGRFENDLRNGGTLAAESAQFTGQVLLGAAGRASLSGRLTEFGALTLERGARIEFTNAEAWAFVHGNASLGRGSGILGPGLVAFNGIVELEGSGFGSFASTGTVRALNESRLMLDIGGTDAAHMDRLGANLFTLEFGVLALRLAPGFVPRAGDVFDFIDGDIAGYGVRVDTGLAPLSEGLVWDDSLLLQTGQMRVLAVPEPPPGALALAGAALLLALHRRRRARR